MHARHRPGSQLAVRPQADAQLGAQETQGEAPSLRHERKEPWTWWAPWAQEAKQGAALLFFPHLSQWTLQSHKPRSLAAMRRWHPRRKEPCDTRQGRCRAAPPMPKPATQTKATTRQCSHHTLSLSHPRPSKSPGLIIWREPVKPKK